MALPILEITFIFDTSGTELDSMAMFFAIHEASPIASLGDEAPFMAYTIGFAIYDFALVFHKVVLDVIFLTASSLRIQILLKLLLFIYRGGWTWRRSS